MHCLLYIIFYLCSGSMIEKSINLDCKFVEKTTIMCELFTSLTYMYTFYLCDILLT